ncbi:MAG: transcription elongation factor [Candidatus Limnocylindria bacterium]
MPEKRTMKRAQRAKRQGKAPTTQAGEFVHEEITHVRRGKHGAGSTDQAIAIGLSKARRAGVRLGEPPRSKPTRSRVQGKKAVSSAALARQARSAARERTAAQRSASARKAAHTRKRRAG